MKRLLQKHFLKSFIICCLIQLSITTSTQAWLPLDLTGNVDLSYGESDLNNNNLETFQQKYSVNWSKNFLSQLSLRSSYRYTKNNLTQNSSNPIWQEIQTPSVNLVWNNSLFSSNTTYDYRKRDASTPALRLSRKSISTDLKTKSIIYPIISLRFNRDHSYNHVDSVELKATERDLLEHRYQAEVHYNHKRSVFHYAFTRRHNENKIRELTSTQNSHFLRLEDSRNLYDNKLKFSTSYSMTYREQTEQRATATSDYFVLNLSSALYAQTDNIRLDSLLQSHELNDGNIEDAAIPFIDIGGTSINHNIGVDFGYEQEVSAIYLYLDQYTDKDIWDVYTSSDNINWESHNSIVDVEFNSAYSRLEIEFSEVKTRYIKVVNVDISDIEHAFVTEIEALEERAINKTIKASSSSHQVNMHSTYVPSEIVSSMFDVSYHHIPGQFGSKKRDNLNYSLSSRIKHSEKVSHSLRLMHNMQFFHGATLDIVNYGISYLIGYQALEKLEFTLSSNMQLDYIDDVKNTNNKSVSLNTKGTPLQDLHVGVNFTFAKNKQYLSERVFYTGNQRYTLDGKVSRSISLLASYSHRTTTFADFVSNEDASEKINRDQYQAGVRIRLTRTIFVRSSLNLNSGDGRYFSHDYMVSWNPSSKLSLSSQLRVQDDDSIRITKRYNSQLNYKLSRNSNLYVSYLISDLTRANGDKNTSIRAGFRTGL